MRQKSSCFHNNYGNRNAFNSYGLNILASCILLIEFTPFPNIQVENIQYCKL